MRFWQSALALIALATVLAADLVAADEPPSAIAAKLPEPLKKISCNLGDLEALGYFTITKVEFGRTKPLNEEGIVWTVKVVKPLACRHAVRLLQRYGDVRFYRKLKDRRMQLLMTELYFPTWIESEAVDQRILRQDQEFPVWVVLSPADVLMLKLREADTAEFGPLRR
jgi:hypothetical protein